MCFDEKYQSQKNKNIYTPEGFEHKYSGLYHQDQEYFMIRFFKIEWFFFVSAILQRATVDVGKIRIQGVATCLFLCMDACGNVYGTVCIQFRFDY